MMHFPIKLINRRWLTDEIFELAFTRPEQIDFKPGQHLRFHHEHGERDYTIISSVTDPWLYFCLKHIQNQGFSAYVADCPIGEIFSVSGPHGQFIHRPSANVNVFVGTGTGIAPFVAFASADIKDYILLQGIRNPRQIIYSEQLRKKSRLYVPCMSQGSDSSLIGFSGRVTDYLKTELDQADYDFYLCGRREMIADATAIIDKRFPDSRVYSERFT